MFIMTQLGFINHNILIINHYPARKKGVIYIIMDREEIIRIFAGNLRAERARKKFSQEYLAEKADITPEYLARVEHEKYSPSLVVIAKLALALGVSVDKLIPLDI